MAKKQYPKSAYAEKLKDPRWQKKRLEILQRDEWKCRRCGNKDKTLHVHHHIYMESDPCNEPSEHLSTLCDDCHESETMGFNESIRILIDTIKTKRMFFNDVDDLCELLSIIDFSYPLEAVVIGWYIKNFKDEINKKWDEDVNNLGNGNK